MGLKRFKEKHLCFALAIAFILYGVASAAYIYRFRNMHISSVESYKKDIQSFQSEIAKIEKEQKTLDYKNELFRKEIVAFGEAATNLATQDYVLQRTFADVTLNQVTESIVDDGVFRILVTGHIYGSPILHETFLAQTLLDALPTLNALEPDLFIALGDTVFHPSHQSFAELENNFFNMLSAPVLNAPGNHDFEAGRDLYEEYFGQSFFYIRQDQMMMVVLDTEVAHCHIVGKQKEMLQDAISEALDDQSVQYIFVFMHKLLFIDPSLSLKEYPNGECHLANNYEILREEIFLPAAAQKPVYLIAGDVGAREGNLSPFFMKDNDVELYAVAAGIGDSSSDVILQLDVYENELSIEIIALGNKEFAPIENYNLTYWSLPSATE